MRSSRSPAARARRLRRAAWRGAAAAGAGRQGHGGRAPRRAGARRRGVRRRRRRRPARLRRAGCVAARRAGPSRAPRIGIESDGGTDRAVRRGRPRGWPRPHGLAAQLAALAAAIWSSSQRRGVRARGELAQARRPRARSSASHDQRVVQRMRPPARRRTGAPATAASPSSSNAPASGERHRTPSRSVDQRAFLRHEVEAVLAPGSRAARRSAGAPATLRGKSSRVSTTTGCQSARAQRSLTAAAACSTSCRYARYSAQRLARRR